MILYQTRLQGDGLHVRVWGGMGRFLHGHRLTAGVVSLEPNPSAPSPAAALEGKACPGGRGSRSRPVSDTTPAECGSGQGRLGLSESGFPSPRSPERSETAFPSMGHKGALRRLRSRRAPWNQGRCGPLSREWCPAAHGKALLFSWAVW